MAKVEFVGRDLHVAFKENPLNIGAGWYQVECECKQRTLKKVIAQNEPTVEDEDGTRHYRIIFPFGEMYEAGITREPVLKLRTIAANGHVSNNYLPIEAINPAPVIQAAPVVTPQLDSVSVTILKPTDADLSGYLMAVSDVEVFDPETHVIFDSASNAFTVPLNSATQTYFARFAAYDEFGKDSLAWTTPQPVSTYNGDFTDVLDDLKDIRDEVEDIHDEVEGIRNDLGELVDTRVDEALEEINTNLEHVNDMLADGLATAEQFEQLGETLLQNQMQGVRETSERIDATYLADQPIGSVVVNEITRTDDLVETTNLIAVKAADGQSVILRTDKVFVQDGVSFAQKLEFMEAKTDQAKADLLHELTVTADAIKSEADSKFTLQTEFGDFQSSVGQQFQSVSDANSTLALFQNRLGAFNADKSAIILDTSKVLVTPSQSLAQKFTSLSAETAQAKADALQEITIATDATKAEANSKFTLLTSFANYQSQVQQNFTSVSTTTSSLAAFDQLLGAKNANGTAINLNSDKVLVEGTTSLSTKLSQMSAATAQAKADALSAITVSASDTKAEIATKYALITSLNDLSSTVTQNFNSLTTTTNSLASFDQILGVKRGDGQSITLNTSKVYIDASTTWSQRDSLIESRFNGTSSSYLLNRANTASSDASSAVNTLQQMGATINNGGAFIMDASKVYVSGGQSVASKISSLESNSNNGATTAYVDSKISAATGPGSSLASQISSANTTANGASSSATLALNAANGNTADIAIMTSVGGRITGQKVNGATGVITFVASAVGFVTNSGGTVVTPLQVIGNKVIATNFQADDIKAGTITADKIVGGAVTNLIVNEYVGQSYFSTGEMEHLSFSYFCEGGKISLDVYCEVGTNTSQAAGAVYRLYCDSSIYNAGAVYCTPSWGQLGSTTPVVVNPGYGSHTFRVTYQATPGSGSIRANRTYVRLTELKK